MTYTLYRPPMPCSFHTEGIELIRALMTSSVSRGATFYVISKNDDAAPTKFWIGHQLTLGSASDPPKIATINSAIQECQM